ncbi:MAG TPA: CPBP family intramembrane glutamic endopeptidase [Pirellulales bacterium]|nr:CPBP family intramembrane glutamic endopeptidase [Pirellulales bacterium]
MTMDDRSNLEPPTDDRVTSATAREASSPETLKQLWLETGVVLALAVVPDFCSACRSLAWPSINAPAFADDRLAFCTRSFQVSVPVLYLIWRSSQPWSAFGLSRPRWLVDALEGLALWMVGIVATTQIWWLFKALLSPRAFDMMAATVEQPMEPPHGGDYVLLLIDCVMNGFAEELVMRGYLIPRFERLLRSTWGSLLLTTALFAAYHCYQGPAGVIEAATFGLVYGAAFCMFRRVWPLALAHAMANFISYFGQ